MPTPKSPGIPGNFGIERAKKGPSASDVFWEMPPQFLGFEPSHEARTKQRKKKTKYFLRRATKKFVALFAFQKKRKGTECKVPNFTDNKVDRAYENFMKQVPGFQRDPPEAKTIQKDIQKKLKKACK